MISALRRTTMLCRLPRAASSLAIHQVQPMPQLLRKDDSVLVQQWWSQRPFDQPLVVPVFSLHDGAYSGSSVTLHDSIFNLPLRRDIIHNVAVWRQKLFKKTTHVTRTKGTTAGSGAKPFKQKGTGRARQGNKRAPGRKGGGRAHGAVMRDYSYQIPKKLRLLGLKTVLSAKLAEGNLIIIQNETQDTPKTQNLKTQLEHFGLDDPHIQTLFILPYEADPNFQRASNRLHNISYCLANRVDVLKLLQNTRVVLTIDSLDQLQQDLLDRTHMRFCSQRRGYKNGQYASLVQRQALGMHKQPISHALPSLPFQPQQPLDLKFQVLRDYVDQYESLKKEGKLQEYMAQRRKSRVHPQDI